MKTPASIRNHPIHPMLVGFPIAFWIGSLVCDLIYLLGSQNTFWKDVAFYSLAGGIIGALAAAVPGYIDYTSLPVSRAKRVGLAHMIINIFVLALYVFNVGLRYAGFPADIFPVILSGLSILFLGVSGWLGGALVYEYGVGINRDEGAHRSERRDRAA